MSYLQTKELPALTQMIQENESLRFTVFEALSRISNYIRLKIQRTRAQSYPESMTELESNSTFDGNAYRPRMHSLEEATRHASYAPYEQLRQFNMMR